MPRSSNHFADHATLSTASPSETVPMLLELTRAQAGRKRPADLLAQLERDRFVHPSFLDQRLVHQLDGMALDAATEFEALHLSPVAPLGTCSVLAPTSQDRTLSTTRGTEVDWVGKLVSQQRLRFVASGFGVQLLPALFKAP